MNILKSDILLALSQQSFRTQRELAKRTGHALGTVNRAIRELQEENFLDGNLRLTEKSRSRLEERRPKNAVILAAGFGMRMVPIGRQTPKALLEVRGETLIERLIRQLQEAGIRDITVVAGYMKESFEYLMDQYGVDLVVNPEYAEKGNFHSLYLVADRLSNTYILPCDIWCRDNPFRDRELHSWYMVKNSPSPTSHVRVGRKMQVDWSPEFRDGNAMVGICYLWGRDSLAVKQKLMQMEADPAQENEFWEEALYEGTRMTVPARVMDGDFATEINTYEQLRDLDSHSEHLKSKEIDLICHCLSCDPGEISNLSVQKKGMTNRSFLFSCRGRKYIMRIPGEGTDQLIDRAQEAAVYKAITPLGICDNLVFMGPESGFKITEFIEGARVCDPENPQDVERCMAKLRGFHEKKLRVEHTFDIFGKIEFYESLWQGQPSVYRDYEKTKRQVYSLKDYIEAHQEPFCLTHIDAVPDNFLFYPDGQGGEGLRLIDWEYAAMQDPHVDLAMFCIYALYSREQSDALIDAYFEGACPRATRLKIYCYIAACGLLWSNWCEYKRNLGVEFGEYALRQYRYAKDYYRLFLQEREKE